jgi:hypothetical protein
MDVDSLPHRGEQTLKADIHAAVAQQHLLASVQQSYLALARHFYEACTEKCLAPPFAGSLTRD